MSKIYIGLSGPEGAGKTTAARLLADSLEGIIVPFAAPLKNMLSALGVPNAALYGDKKEEPLHMLGGKTARQAMQTLGTEWGRNLIAESLWVDAWTVTTAQVPHQIVIADDVRMRNEAQRIYDLGGVVIQIIRSSADLHREPKHVSEDFRAVPAAYTIINNQSLDGLRDVCFQIIRQHFLPVAHRQSA